MLHAQEKMYLSTVGMLTTKGVNKCAVSGSFTGSGASHTVQSVHLQCAVLGNKRDIKVGPQAAQLLCAADACYAPTNHHAAHGCTAFLFASVARQLRWSS